MVAGVLGSVNSQVRPTVQYIEYTCLTQTLVAKIPSLRTTQKMDNNDGCTCICRGEAEYMYMWLVRWEKYN
jgi:hypothetical protein